MKSKFRILGIILPAAIFTLISISGCGKSDEPEPPLENRVYFGDNIEVTGGDEFSVDVLFENNEPVSAISLPLKFPDDVLRCDSVVYRNGRCKDFFLKPYFVKADTIQIGAIDTVGVTAGRGVLVTLYFWAYGNAPDTTVSFDLHFNPTLPFAYADTSLSGETILPEFEPAEITVHTQIVPE